MHFFHWTHGFSAKDPLCWLISITSVSTTQIAVPWWQRSFVDIILSGFKGKICRKPWFFVLTLQTKGGPVKLSNHPILGRLGHPKQARAAGDFKTFCPIMEAVFRIAHETWANSAETYWKWELWCQSVEKCTVAFLTNLIAFSWICKISWWCLALVPTTFSSRGMFQAPPWALLGTGPNLPKNRRRRSWRRQRISVGCWGSVKSWTYHSGATKSSISIGNFRISAHPHQFVSVCQSVWHSLTNTPLLLLAWGQDSHGEFKHVADFNLLP